MSSPMKYLAAIMLGLAVCGCATLDPSLPDLERTDAGLRPIAHQQEVPDAPIALVDALARGLSYNTRYREQHERFLATAARSGLTRNDFMPRTVISAGADFRSNIDASVGVRVDDMNGNRPEDFYTASDRNRSFASLSSSWNLLDFGLAFYTSRIEQAQASSEAEQSLISCAYLSEDIVRVYWLAAAHERATAKNDWLRSRVDTALYLSRQRAESAPETRTAELLYQREIIDIYRWYQSIYTSISPAKAELASLMNLPTGSEFVVEADHAIQKLPDLPSAPEDLLEVAFAHRPEIEQRRHAYNIIDLQRRREIVSVMPSPAVVLGGRQDSNSFALNNSFASLGTTVSWDLFRLANIEERLDSFDRQMDIAVLETETLASAIAMQVEMARLEFETRDETISMAWQATDIQVELANRMAAEVEVGVQPEIYLIKEELFRELSVLRRDIDRAGHQAARMRLMRSLGLAPNCHALPIGQGHDAVRESLVDMGFATAPETDQPI